MCHNCNLGTMNDLLANAKADEKGYLFRIVLNGIFFVAGIATWLAQGSVAPYFTLAGIGAVPALLRAMKPDLSEQIQAGVERAGGDFTTTLLGPIVRLVLAFVVGAIASPFIILFSVFKYFGAKKRIVQYTEEIENYQSA